MEHSIFIKELPGFSTLPPVQQVNRNIIVAAPPETQKLVFVFKAQKLTSDFLDNLKNSGITIDESKKAEILEKIAAIIEEARK